jgi:hypothetical protein
MPVLPVVLLLVILAGSLPAFSNVPCCYSASFEPSPPYANNGCVCIWLDKKISVGFIYDPSNLYWNDDISFCSSVMDYRGDVCGRASFNCTVSDSGVISCSSSSSPEDNPFLPSSFSCPSFPCEFDYPSGSGSSSACRSVNNLIDTFQGVKEGFLKVFIGSSFAFGLLGGAYAVLRVVF